MSGLTWRAHPVLKPPSEAEIARMEEELARLKSDDAASAALAPAAPAPAGGASASTAGQNKAPGAP